MSRGRLLAASCAVALAVLAPQAAATPGAPGVEQLPAAWANYEHVHRAGSAIRLVVVHVTEASFGGTVAWFRNRHAQVSAHYVVGRDGAVAQMVPNADVAWHAGNGWVNAHSIGVENEGIVEVPGTFTDAEYRASARVVAAILRRYRIPADRRHVIGHDQVPDPFHPGQFGGYSHHTDPGRYWDWQRYMGYVRAYLAGRTPPPPALDVSIPGIGLDQTVTGTTEWSAAVTGEPVTQVQFLVDGQPRATASAAPYAFDWQSAAETNGKHVLTVVATGVDGKTASASVVAETANPLPPPPTVGGIGIENGATVSGVVPIAPELGGGPLGRVELWVDGAVVATDTAAPWTFQWDTTGLALGQHTVAVRAVGPRGGSTATIVLVTVGAPTPAPPPGP